MLYINPGAKAQVKGLFPVYGVLKTLPHKSLSYRAISLGNGTYILAYGIAKGTLVKRGYLLN
jgi:hypothetical protein